MASRLFPPPRYLVMPSVGLDVSDRSFHGVGLEQSASRIDIARYFEKLIPSGLIKDGIVEDHAGLVSVLRELKKEQRLQFVNVSLPERHGYVFELTLPMLSPSDIRSAIEPKLEDNVPISAHSAVFDYTVVGDEEWDGSSKLQVGVSVYPRSIVEGYMDAFEEAGCIPLRFEIEVYSIARSVVPDDFGGVVLIGDIGFDRTTIIIVSGGVVKYSSTISIGGDHMVRAIVENSTIKYEEAEKRIHASGIHTEIDGTRIPALDNVIDDLIEEIAKQFNYWNSHHSADLNELISHILLSGGGANTKGLLDMLDTRIDVNVDYANVFANLGAPKDNIPDISFEKSLSHASSIGLALDL